MDIFVLIIVYFVFIFIPCSDVLVNTKNKLHMLQMVIVMFISALLIFGIIRLKIDIKNHIRGAASYAAFFTTQKQSIMNFDELITINGVTLRATGSVYIGNGDDDDRDEMENLEIYAPDSDVNLYEVIGVLAEVESQVWGKIK